MIMRPYDHVIIWLYGHMIIWSYDHMVIWSYHHIIDQTSKIFLGFRVEKWNVGDHLKRVLAKFQANRRHPRGVNGPSKFAKISQNIRRKMKCRGSSETRFPEVWGQTEPSSRGKRPNVRWPSAVRIILGIISELSLQRSLAGRETFRGDYNFSSKRVLPMPNDTRSDIVLSGS